MIAVVGAKRLDPVALTFGFRLTLGVVEYLPRLLRVFRRGRPDERIAEQVDCESPVSHHTARLFPYDRLKRFTSLRKPVRMQHRHATLELFLRRRTTRYRKMNLAELYGGFLLRHHNGAGEKRKNDQQHKQFHDLILTFLSLICPI